MLEALMVSRKVRCRREASMSRWNSTKWGLVESFTNLTVSCASAAEIGIRGFMRMSETRCSVTEM